MVIHSVRSSSKTHKYSAPSGPYLSSIMNLRPSRSMAGLLALLLEQVKRWMGILQNLQKWTFWQKCGPFVSMNIWYNINLDTYFQESQNVWVKIQNLNSKQVCGWEEVGIFVGLQIQIRLLKISRLRYKIFSCKVFLTDVRVMHWNIFLLPVCVLSCCET